MEGATVAWGSPMSHPYNRALCLLIAEAFVLRSPHSHLFGQQPSEIVVAKISDQICKYLKYLCKKRAQQEQQARLTTLVAHGQVAFEVAIKKDLSRADKRRSDVSHVQQLS